MSIDRLQERIRKLKNPTVVEFDLLQEHIPAMFLEQESFFPGAFECYSKVLLDALKDAVPAVRFSMNQASVYGPEGLMALRELLRYATELGYYVILDGPAAFSARDGERTADLLLDGSWKFDALAVTAYIGSDAIRPCFEKLKDSDKALFVLTRSSNRSCQEIQDLLTGSRLVYQAMADVVNRFAQGGTGRSGYGAVAAIAPANAPKTLAILREKYKYQFLLVEGYDAPSANAKNCANAFDRLGHGACVCAGTSITAAWQEDPWTQADYREAALEAAMRMKKNLLRYVTVL